MYSDVEEEELALTLADEIKAARAKRWRQDIIEGKIDVGPNAHVAEDGSIVTESQAVPAEDNRDLRDPQVHGLMLLHVRKKYLLSLQEAADEIDQGVHGMVMNYDGNPVDHSVTRQRELQERAAEGDRFAAAVLRGDSLAEDPVD